MAMKKCILHMVGMSLILLVLKKILTLIMQHLNLTYKKRVFYMMVQNAYNFQTSITVQNFRTLH